MASLPMLPRTAFIALTTSALLLAGRTTQAQVNAPTFSKNYFVTGDVVVSGVALKGTGSKGFATGQITVTATAMPADAEPVAAFLYWMTVVSDTDRSGALAGVQFKGHNIATLSKVLNPLGTSPCWSSGGGTGSSGGGKRMVLGRADVLRYLDRDRIGRPIATGSHTVRLPDSGKAGNSIPFTLGASL